MTLFFKRSVVDALESRVLLSNWYAPATGCGKKGFREFSPSGDNYTIQMPATAKLEVEDYKSEIKVSDLKADLKIHTYKGTVRVASLDGAARVNTYKGDVRVAFARFSRASRFDTYKGEIDVRLPGNSRFELAADTGRRGDIESDFAMTTRPGRSRSARAMGAVNGGGEELRLTTYKGTLRVKSS